MNSAVSTPSRPTARNESSTTAPEPTSKARAIDSFSSPEIEAAQAPEDLKSPKSRLQEETQKVLGERPEYRLLEASGPDHDKVFRVEVVVGDEVLGMGVGGSRRMAETAAAAEAVEVLAARSAETATAVAGA